jgi:hypothetical protein
MESLLLISAAIIVTACSNNSPSFLNMSAIELAAHNRGLPAEEQVFCVRDADSSIYIRKRVCQSYEDWLEHNVRVAMTMDVLNLRSNYSLPNSIQDGSARD